MWEAMEVSGRVCRLQATSLFSGHGHALPLGVLVIVGIVSPYVCVAANRWRACLWLFRGLGVGCGVCVPRVSTGTRGPKGLCLFSGLIDGPRSGTAPAARRPRRHIHVAPDLPCCVCGVHFPSPSLSSQARSRPSRSLPPNSLSLLKYLSCELIRCSDASFAHNMLTV